MRKIMLTLASVASLSAFGAIPTMGATMEGSVGGAGDTLTPKAQAVCDGPFVLTPEAFAACQSGEFPVAIADGSRYRNTGIGAEFNTLIRQLPTVTATDGAPVSVPSAN